MHLRAGSRDVDILVEIFGSEIYAPPPVAQRALDGAPVRRVLDLGANVGLFAVDALRRYPDAVVESWEPDPTNLDLLNACRDAHPQRERWEIRPVAAGVQDGSVGFVIGEHSESRVPYRKEQDRTDLVELPMRDVLGSVVEADVMKIDIEGGEWPILLDERLAGTRARVVALEYHGQHNPGPDGPRAATRLLEQAGFEVHPVGRLERPSGQVWGVRV